MKEINNKQKIKVIFWILLLLSICFVYRDFILGRGYFMYVDIGSDTFMQFYPYYTNIALRLSDGSLSTWNWDMGLGLNSLTTLRLIDPFSFLLAVIGAIFGAGVMAPLLVWMQIVKIIVIFICARKFFSYFLSDEISVCFASFTYSMSGFLLLWGQHYYLGTACLYIILELCAIEYYIRNEYKKGGFLISLSTGFCLLFSYYVGYEVLLFSGIYFLYRIFSMDPISKGKDLKEYSSKILKTLFYVVDGILISGLIFIPSCINIMTGTGRFGHGGDSVGSIILSDFASSFSIDEIGIRLSRMISNNMLGINETEVFHGTNYYEAPELFCSVFIFFFFGQWIVGEIKNAKKNKSQKALIIKLILFYLLIFNNAVATIFAVFTGVSYRNMFLAVLFICLMMGQTVERIINGEGISKLGLLIGVILTMFAWSYSYLNCTGEVKSFVKKMLILLIIGVILLAIAVMVKSYKRQILVVFLLFVMGTTMLDGWYATVHRAYIARESYGLEWDKSGVSNDTAKALSYLKENDHSFYRVEKTYYDWYLMADSYLEKYSTTEWYQSTQNKNIVEFYDKVYMNNALSGNGMAIFRLDNELDLESLNIVNSKYILSKEPLNHHDFEEIGREGEVMIYRNHGTSQIAKWYTNTISKEEYDKIPVEDRRDVLSRFVITDDLSLDIMETDARIENFVLDGQSKIDGRVACIGEGILMLSIPHEDGWEVYANGVKQELINCDYGFVGIHLPGGEYEITAKYHIPYGKAGLVLSIIGVLALLICVWTKERRVKP